MTEDEAKTKWCPFVRMTASQGEWHINRDPSLQSSPQDTQAYRCIASACMAWRATDGEMLTRIETGERVFVATGFCGLARPS